MEIAISFHCKKKSRNEKVQKTTKIPVISSFKKYGCSYAKWNKSGRERQIPYGFTYMWNLKTNKQNKTKTDLWKQRPKGCLPDGRG